MLGNVGKSAEDNASGTPGSTPSANTAPYSATTSAPTASRTTTSLTITASATDREQSTLSYALYFNGSYKQTVSGTRGNTVTFNAITGLSEATSYSWYVTVSDGVGGSARANGSAYTNCSSYPRIATQCGRMRWVWIYLHHLMRGQAYSKFLVSGYGQLLVPILLILT